MPILGFLEDSPNLALNPKKSLRQNCDYQMSKSSYSCMRFSSELLIKYVPQNVRYQLLNSKCKVLTKANALRWQKPQAR